MHAHGGAPSEPSLPVGQQDAPQSLAQFIDLDKAAALNADSHSYVKTILSPLQATANGILKSDDSVDEQLLIVIPFREAVKLRAISILATKDQTNDQQSAPKSIKIWSNQPNIQFDDVDSVAPTQQFELTAEQTSEGSHIPLKLVKFNNVHSITIFIADNQIGTPVTYVNRVDCIGSSIAGFDVANIKKIGEE